jgi:non-ribosomal peptide synthetase component F
MMKSDQSIAFWSDHLKDVQPCHVPTEIRHEVADTVQNFGFIRLPARATDGLTAFCRRLGITQAAFVQTAWAIVLGAFTRQDDVCFGYIASGRDAPLDGIEGCIGPFISMQVCRVRINGTVDEVLHRVHSDVIAGLEHRNSSLALIQSALDLKATPLFNTCVTLRRALEGAEQTKLDSLIKSVHGPEKTEVWQPIFNHLLFEISY